MPGAQEAGQAERPDLFRRIPPGQQAGQVAALAVARGHDEAEMIERAAPVVAGQPAGEQCQQRHRHQQRRHGEQRYPRADRAGHRTPEPLQPEYHLRRPHHPRLRPRDPIMELGLVEGCQLYRTGHVEDPVLSIARGQLGQHPLLLAQHHPGHAQDRRDGGEESEARPDTGQAGAPVLGSQDRLQHPTAHHHLGRDPDPGEHLERRHGDQLAPPRVPGDRQPGPGQPRYFPRRPPLPGGVHLVDGRPSPFTAA
jgi:hypothetical protein